VARIIFAVESLREKYDIALQKIFGKTMASFPRSMPTNIDEVDKTDTSRLFLGFLIAACT